MKAISVSTIGLGVNQNPTWTDFENFLGNRCFPRDRQNLKLELKNDQVVVYKEEI